MTHFEIDVLTRAIQSRIIELEGLTETLGINYDGEIETLEAIAKRLSNGCKIVSRETMCKSVIDWFQKFYEDEW